MILISTQCFPPAQGGIETLMYALASTLAGAGEHVRVFADHHSSPEREFDKCQPFPVFRYAGIKPLRRRKKARDIFRASVEHSSPALITDSWKSLELLDTRHCSTVICLAHGTEIPLQSNTSRANRVRNAYSRATYIVANSHYTAERVKPYAGDPGKIRVILPGITAPVDDPAMDEKIRQRLAGHDPVLITIARLEDRKGQKAVISILPVLLAEFPQLLYIIAGEGSGRKELEAAVESSGTQSHVVFTGAVSDPEKSAWLKASTLFIMPGRQAGQDVEGFGLAYIEAAMQGVPAIACKVGGAPEAVLHRQTGLVCKPDDNESLAQLTLELLRNRPYIRQLGMNARARARSLLWQNKYSEYQSLLHRE